MSPVRRLLSKRTVGVALAAGVAAGATAAVAIPSAESTPRDEPFAAPSLPQRTAPARQRERGPAQKYSTYLRAHPGTVRIEQRANDPAGGPEWAVRAFDADRTIPPSERRPGSDGVIGVGLCAQLGRIVDGRFGWIDGSNTFRPVTTKAMEASPTQCWTRRLDEKRTPLLDRVALVDRPDTTTATIRGSVVWGLAGGTAQGLRVETRGRIATPKPAGPHGAFITFFAPNVVVSDAVLRTAYRSGKTSITPKGRGDGFAPAGYRPEKGDAIEPSTSQVAARTFDPAGGLSWGMLAVRTKKGLWCAGGNGTLIGEHVGTVNAPAGTMWEEPAAYGPNGCGARAQPTKKYPVQYGWGGGAYLDGEGTPSPNAKALRLQQGRTVYWGRALPDVDRVTFATPRDVRTIVPTGPAHAFIMVYDGTFGSGTTKITAHFRDGHTWSDTQENVNF
ncbi:MAG: hypothetical protein J7513_14755 [Solirubrobacteraceae bacterium]|nr:hypothetical protein [Solirubrobacteraceae bacterium]